MAVVKIAWSDSDRTPYLYMVKHAAAAHGLDVELVRGGYGDFPRILLEGDCDFIGENYYNLQTYCAKGVPLVSLACAENQLNEKLIVQPAINRLDDLRGKKIAIRARHSTDLTDIQWVKDSGLANDLEIVMVDENEVGRWAMWKKVQDGTCAATFITNLYVDEALKAGLKVLPVEPYGFLGNVVLTTRRDVVEARRSDILDLVRAAFDASHSFRTDAAATMRVLQHEPRELMKVEPKQMERIYELIRDELAPMPMPLPASISNFHRMMLPEHPYLADYNPLLMWDLSFASQVWQERQLRIKN